MPKGDFMVKKVDDGCDCGCGGSGGAHHIFEEPLLRLIKTSWSDEELRALEKKSWVAGFAETRAGRVPFVSQKIGREEVFGAVRARLWRGKTPYSIPAGLYAFGSPDAGSPLVATCNYKLTFDILREEWKGQNLWVLVLDTRGINVWCAAGKGTFGTSELLRRLEFSRVKDIVAKAEIILPQYGAVGVSAHEVKKASGFRVFYGPIRASDLGEYLANGRVATARMREATFTLWERLVLIPMEFGLLLKHSKWAFPVAFALAGISGFGWSAQAAWERGFFLVSMLLGGIFAGAALVPAFLRAIPGRPFAMKGLITGALASAAMALGWPVELSPFDRGGAALLAAALSSFAAMNFTGSTPFTSPTGVEREMRRYLPVQIAAALTGLGLFVASGFMAGG